MQRSALLHFAAAMLGVVFLTACDPDEPPRPTIADQTEAGWLTGPPQFVAQIGNLDGWEILAVTFRYRRHYFPEGPYSDAPANAVDGIADTSVPGRYVAAVGDLAAAPAGDHIWYYIDVSYRPADAPGADSRRRFIPPKDFVKGCADGVFEAQLAAARDHIVANFGTPGIAPHNFHLQPGSAYPGLPHSFVSLKDHGFLVASPSGAINMPVSDGFNSPALLFYRPRPQQSGETDSAYYSAMTDLAADPPYELIGWTYGALYQPGDPPSLGCVPSSAWFVHEAGWHTPDGGMAAHPHSEAVPGEAALNGVLPPPDAESPAPGSWWHPRLWDLHVWLDGDGPPVVQIANPAGVVGLDLDHLFFRHKVWQ